jgi:putative ABC transport system permease protein
VSTGTRVPGEQLYGWLLRLYPRSFREEYGADLLDFYRDRFRAAVQERARIPLRFWLRVYADLFTSAIAERVSEWRNPVPSTRDIDPGESAMFSSLLQDLRLAARTMLRTPGFTITVLLTLALGIGANVAIFSVVNGVLLRPLPFAEPDRIIQLAYQDEPATLSEPEVVDLTRDAKSFTNVGAYSFSDATITGGEEAEGVRMARVNAGFFRVLQPTMALGRGFTADEDLPGRADVVVLSWGLWQRRFGSERNVLGQQITISGVRRTIIGVAPQNFDYPSAAVAVWTPLRMNPDSLWGRANHYLRVIARLSPRATIASADAEVTGIKARWATAYPETYDADNPLVADVKSIRDRMLGSTQPYLLALLGAVGFVLLIVCVNVANLLISRGEARRRELAIRGALGASGRRIASTLIAESALLTAAGGGLGVGLAWPLQGLLLATAPGSIPRLAEIRIDARVLGFSIAVAILTGLLFALVPLARAGTSALGSLGAARSAGQARGRGTRRVRGVLVISEIALAVVMLTGAGLFLRSLTHLQQTDLGFATDDLLTMKVRLARAAYNNTRAAAFIQELTERVQQLPGVQHSAALAWTPIVEGGGNWSVVSDAMSPTVISQTPTASPQQVTPDFFATLSIPLIRGRPFTAADREAAPLVAIVNQALARKLWGGADPLGHRLRVFDAPDGWATVVGVVGDTRADGLTEPAPPIMYFPHAQAAQSSYFTALTMTLAVKTSGSSASLVAAIKQVVRELDASVPVSDIRTMEEVVGSSIASHRFTALILTGFALLALLLAGIGIYGVIAYAVTQRRYEFGVRMALGAERASVFGLVLREGLVLTGVGLVTGVAGALVAGRFLRAMLVGVGAIDLMTLGLVSLFLLVVSLLALALPARQAIGVSPTESLRSG